MWPSLPVANQIADWANIFLIGSLVVGVVSTVAIVAMSGVKEQYWEEDRRGSAERIAALTTQGDKLRNDTADANARAAEATQKATEAQLELEKLKQPRVFSLVQISSLADKLRPFANTRFDMAVIPSDPEAVVFMSHIAAMLEKAGWTWVAYGHPGGPFMTVYTMDGKPNIGQQGWSAVSIQVFADHATEFSAAADALLAALKAEGVVATRDEANAAIPNHDALHIVVGKKPL